MDNPDKRKKLGLKAQKDMEEHAENVIWEKWKDLIQRHVNKGKLSDDREEFQH